MTEKEIELIKTKVRSGISGQEVIKVIYIGNVNGFHKGNVIEAKARYAEASGKKFPHPKYRHVCYEIEDEDGDTFEVSQHGTGIASGFLRVPDDFPLGPILKRRYEG